MTSSPATSAGAGDPNRRKFAGRTRFSQAQIGTGGHLSVRARQLTSQTWKGVRSLLDSGSTVDAIFPPFKTGDLQPGSARVGRLQRHAGIYLVLARGGNRVKR